MTKELKDGVEEFDGDPVGLYKGRFSGGFDLETVLGASLARDDYVTFVVTARCGKATFDVDKTGTQVRQNTFIVDEVTALSPDKAQWLYDSIGSSVEIPPMVDGWAPTFVKKDAW